MTIEERIEALTLKVKLLSQESEKHDNLIGQLGGQVSQLGEKVSQLGGNVNQLVDNVSQLSRNVSQLTRIAQQTFESIQSLVRTAEAREHRKPNPERLN